VTKQISMIVHVLVVCLVKSHPYVILLSPDLLYLSTLHLPSIYRQK